MDPLRVVASLFGRPRALVGVVHVGALPGTPLGERTLDALVDDAVNDARRYAEAGFDGLMIENMHDRPYLKGRAGPEIVSALAVIGREVRRAVDRPLGVQVLAGANREALAVAHACGASFVRVEGFAFAHVADEGLIEACAGDLLRYRRMIGATGVRIVADVKKKHAAHAITADVDLVETARAAAFFLADAVVVTGPSTGSAASPAEVDAVASSVELPTFVGSGITPENLRVFAAADGFIVGTAAKQGGDWASPVAPERARALVEAFRALPPRP